MAEGQTGIGRRFFGDTLSTGLTRCTKISIIVPMLSVVGGVPKSAIESPTLRVKSLVLKPIAIFEKFTEVVRRDSGFLVDLTEISL